LIANRVAITVVDRFEMIGVQQRQRQRGLVAPRPVKFLVSAFHEVPAVMQASQAVGRRQLQQLRLRLLPFGDLLLQLNRVLAESGQRSAEGLHGQRDVVEFPQPFPPQLRPGGELVLTCSRFRVTRMMGLTTAQRMK
jgi:hypothetical protein